MKKSSPEKQYTIEPVEEEEALGDIYDLINEGIKVHSTGVRDYITSDFTLSDLSEETLKNPVIKFIKEQIKLCVIIKDYIQDQTEGARIVNLLMTEVFSIVIMSRARKGQIIRAILETGKRAEVQIGDQEDEKPFIMKEKQQKEATT